MPGRVVPLQLNFGGAAWRLEGLVRILTKVSRKSLVGSGGKNDRTGAGLKLRPKAVERSTLRKLIRHGNSQNFGRKHPFAVGNPAQLCFELAPGGGC